MLKVKGYELEEPAFRDSFDRRAVKVQNSIYATLKQLNIERDDARIPMEKMARMKSKASVAFWFEGRNLKYTYSLMPRFIDNLYVVDKILTVFVDQLFEKEITLDQFQREFSDDDKIDEKLAEARKALGVDEDETDFELISKNYKSLAKKHHPDMGGDHKEFQKINAAHKMMKKELE